MSEATVTITLAHDPDLSVAYATEAVRSLLRQCVADTDLDAAMRLFTRSVNKQLPAGLVWVPAACELRGPLAMIAAPVKDLFTQAWKDTCEGFAMLLFEHVPPTR